MSLYVVLWVSIFSSESIVTAMHTLILHQPLPWLIVSISIKYALVCYPATVNVAVDKLHVLRWNYQHVVQLASSLLEGLKMEIIIT